MFSIFSKAAGYTLAHVSALLTAGHMDAAMPPPDASRFNTVEEIAQIVHMDSPDLSMDSPTKEIG